MTYINILQGLATKLENTISTDGPELNSKHIFLYSAIIQALNPSSGGSGGAVTQGGVWTIRTQDTYGQDLISVTSTPAGTERGLIVRNIPSGTQSISGTVGITGVYNSANPTATDTQPFPLQLDGNGKLHTKCTQNGTWNVGITGTPTVNEGVKTMQYASGLISTSGDNTVITSPGAGLKLVLVSIRIQNESTTNTTVLLKNNSTTFSRVMCVNQGDGMSASYGPGRELRMAVNTPLILNLNGANNVGYSIIYFVE